MFIILSPQVVLLYDLIYVLVQIRSSSSRACGFVDKSSYATMSSVFPCGQACGFSTQVVHTIPRTIRFVKL